MGGALAVLAAVYLGETDSTSWRSISVSVAGRWSPRGRRADGGGARVRYRRYVTCEIQTAQS